MVFEFFGRKELLQVSLLVSPFGLLRVPAETTVRDEESRIEGLRKAQGAKQELSRKQPVSFRTYSNQNLQFAELQP
jgi:hypothetical protein